MTDYKNEGSGIHRHPISDLLWNITYANNSNNAYKLIIVNATARPRLDNEAPSNHTLIKDNGYLSFTVSKLYILCLSEITPLSLTVLSTLRL